MPDEPASLPELSRAGLPALPRLAEYQLLEKLGEGAMGIVYRAMHVDMERVVALKVLAKEHLQDERSVARFKREMVAVAKLDHPNIVRAYDARQIDDCHVLIMEYLRGFTLEQLAAHLGPLPTPDACELIRQAAEGLHHAHGHGLVHRDIKPSNLLLVRVEHAVPLVKILDLGLARIREGWPSDVAITRPGFLLGTPDYMAPEQIKDSHNVDIRADIYSLGCTLFRLLVGHAPFADRSPRSIADTMEAHASETPSSICQLRPDAPAGLAEVVARMLAKRAVERFGSPKEVSLALAPFCGGCDLTRLLTQAEAGADDHPEDKPLVAQAGTPLPPAPSEDANRPLVSARHPASATLSPDATHTSTRRREDDRRSSRAARILLHPLGIAGGVLILLAAGFVFLMLNLRDEKDRDVSVDLDRVESPDGTKVSEEDTATGTPSDQFDPAPLGSAAGRRPRSWILLSRTAQASVKPDLWLYTTDGRIRLRVTRTPDVFETQPSFSPDCHHVVFVRSETPGEMTSIWICKVDGSGQRRLVRAEVDGQRLLSPRWASDDEICFTWLHRSADAPRTELWRMRLDDEEPTFAFDFRQALGVLGGVVTDLSFDDRQLLVVGNSSRDPASTDVYLTDLQGNLLHRLWKDSEEHHHDAGAMLSDDGRQIVWQHDLQPSTLRGSSRYAMAWATRSDMGEWTVEVTGYPEASVLPLGWSSDGRDLLCVRAPSGPPGRARAVFFFTDERFQNVHDLFELPDWYMPHDLNVGLVADWRRLPPDVRLPLPEQPRIRKPKSLDRRTPRL